MRILISGSHNSLGTALLRRLAITHDVTALDRDAGAEDSTLTYQGDVRDRDFAATASSGCDAIIHFLPAAGSATAADLLDTATRGTYNLVTTTAATRFILVSSLAM